MLIFSQLHSVKQEKLIFLISIKQTFTILTQLTFSLMSN
jgi:hypothetical protein